MRRYLYLVLVLLSSNSWLNVSAMVLSQNDYLYRIWSVESGLPQISVTALAQDEQGFLWVGTQNGLARFDGLNFQVFNTANTADFSSNFITALHFDKQQRLWIGTVNGLMRFENKTFTRLDRQPLKGGVTSIAELADGRIFIGAAHLYQWQEQQQTLERVMAHHGPVFQLHQQQDALWLGGLNGYALLENDQYQWFGAPEQTAELQVTQIVKQGKDLYLGTNQGLFRYQYEQWQPLPLPGSVGNTRIELLYLDPQQRVWVASYDKLYQLKQGQLTVEDGVLGKPGEFSWVESMLQDKFGNLWLGSHSHGLKRLRRPPTQRFSKEQGINDPYVWAVQPWQHHILAGTNSGISLLQHGQFQPLSANQYLPNLFVYSMLIDGQQRLWVGTRAGLSRLDGKTLEWRRNYNEISHVLVTSITQENDRIWVGTNGGLFYVDNDELHQQQVPEVLRSAQIRIVMVDSQQRLWVGTENGLFLRDGDSFAKLEGMPLSDRFISAIKELADGNIFIGSFDQGFVLGKPKHWQWFTQQKGLPSSGVLHVEQIENQLLISSFQGFYRINYPELRQGRVEQVYMLVDDRRPEAASDSHRCCNGAGSSKGAVHQGRLWYPTLDGVLALPLQQLIQYGPIPQPVLDSLTVSGENYSASSVNLSPNKRDWHFRFTAPFFMHAASVLFRYKLEGYDISWVDAGRRREAFYTNLPPGQYRFIIQVRLASDYRWSEPIGMNVYLAPHWYETATARALALILLLLIFWAVYRWRLMALAKAKQQLEIIVTQRTAELYQVNKKLECMSMQDALTGLNNRHYLDTNIKQILSRSDRSNEPLVWALLDLDFFKRINDTFGHHTGDEILIIVAELLRQNSRDTDHLIRWGGEEFLLVLEHSQDALLVLQRIHQAVAQYPWQQDMGLKQSLTCSIGAVAQLSDWDWQHSLRLADHALYWVKQHGRNGYLLLDISSPAPAELLDENVNITELLAQGKLQATSNKDITEAT
ncbi:diguanylate cyclase domain-containing protein [Rheinheimera metallidurans]|uniref:diguanylate cyclase domain-containing protein n=1 Tax=Rheinheimera metallidurans TaxID=2925781 RepID=UPI0030021112